MPQIYKAETQSEVRRNRHLKLLISPRPVQKTSSNWRRAGGPQSGCLRCHVHPVTTNQREGQTITKQTMAPLSVEDDT